MRMGRRMCGYSGRSKVLKSISKSVGINSTYRYCNAIMSGWRMVGSFNSSNLRGINYVGQGTQDYNVMMVPISGFNYDGDFKKLKISIYLWCSTPNYHTFRWAVTTSRAYEYMYEWSGAITEPYQLGTGTFTPDYNYGSFAYQTFELNCKNVPSNTPIYIYLWRDSTRYGNIHVLKDTTVTLEYMG